MVKNYYSGDDAKELGKAKFKKKYLNKIDIVVKVYAINFIKLSKKVEIIYDLVKKRTATQRDKTILVLCDTNITGKLLGDDGNTSVTETSTPPPLTINS